MLGKLMKYDMKALARYMLPLYALLLVSTCGMKVTLELSQNSVTNIFRGLFISAYVISLIAIGTGSLIILIVYFYKNLMTEHGYLSFTLPVTPTQHLVSKLLNGAAWMVFTTIAVLLSILLLLLGHLDQVSLSELADIFQGLMAELQELGLNQINMLFLLIFGLFSAVFGSQIIIYFCICMGQLFGSHRVLGAFVSYFGLSFLTQIISAIYIVIGIRIFAWETVDVNEIGKAIGYFLNGTLLLNLLLSLILFFVTRWLMEKKLNLE